MITLINLHGFTPMTSFKGWGVDNVYTTMTFFQGRLESTIYIVGNTVSMGVSPILQKILVKSNQIRNHLVKKCFFFSFFFSQGIREMHLTNVFLVFI